MKIEFIWQQDIADEEQTWSFDQLVDELVSIASCIDRSGNDRDQWELNYYVKRLNERFNDTIPPEKKYLHMHMKEMETFDGGEMYICSECKAPGWPSIFYDTCTRCANVKRGVGYGT